MRDGKLSSLFSLFKFIYVESIIESQGVTILNRSNPVIHFNSETKPITFNLY